MCIRDSNVRTVQLHQLGFHQLGGVIVPGNADGLSGAAYGFHQQVHNLVQHIPVNPLGEMCIRDSDGIGHKFPLHQAVVPVHKLVLQNAGILAADVVKVVPLRPDFKALGVLLGVDLALGKRILYFLAGI